MATYLEKQTLAQDADFIKRVTFAIAKFAKYILDEDPAAANHKARFKWAQVAIMNPASVAGAIAPAVTLDPAVDADLGLISDAALQSAVEAACAQLLFN